MKSLSVTGIGVVSPLGIGTEAFVAGLAAARSEDVFKAPETFDAARYPQARVAEVRGFDATKYLGDKGLRTLDRLTRLLLVATRLAAHESGLKKDGAYVALGAQRVGLCCSTAYGSLEAITELDRVAVLEDARYLNPAKFPNTVINSAAGYASIWEDMRALNVTVSNGNTGSFDAIFCAGMYLDAGGADAILAGGAEAMNEALYLAFQRLSVLREQSPGERDGVRLGESAALLVLEHSDSAEKRGARALARITGYGSGFDPPESEVLIIHPSREAMSTAMRSALDDAACSAADVDLVVSSVSGLGEFDRAEMAAIDEVLGPNVAVAAHKRVLGETLGAAGAFGAVCALAWMDALGANVPIGQALVRGSLSGPPRRVLCTSVGFYGTAAAVLIERQEA